jgi:DNA polymerase IV
VGRSRKESRIARTVVLKLKTQRIQDSHSQPHASYSTVFLRGADEYRPLLRERVGMSSQQRFRLVGVDLSNFHDPEDASAQPTLFT